MRFEVIIEGKKYKLSFWKWLAYTNQRRLIRIEKKLNELLNKGSDKGSNESADNGDSRPH